MKSGRDIAVYTRTGRDCSRLLLGLVEAFHSLPARSCIIDGELVADEEHHAGDTWTLHRAMREGRHEDSGKGSPYGKRVLLRWHRRAMPAKHEPAGCFETGEGRGRSEGHGSKRRPMLWMTEAGGIRGKPLTDAVS